MLRRRLLLWLLPLLLATIPPPAAARPEGCPSPAGPPVRIAVIDSGVDLDHPDLKPFIARESGGGVIGYDFITDSAPGSDAYGHGTHVSSLIAAALVKACVPHELMPLRILDQSGRGSRQALARAIRWAADHGARVLNLSLVHFTYDQDVDRAVQYAWDRGAVIVAAAGNTGRSAVTFPAGYLHVLGVAAVTDDGQPLGLSGYGEHIALAAPGFKRRGALPLHPSTLDPLGTGSGELTGSSQAAAGVAAAAARWFAADPTLTNTDLYRNLQRYAAGSGTGWDPRIGYGVVRGDLPLVEPAERPGSLLVQLVSAGKAPPWGASVVVEGEEYLTDMDGFLRLRNLAPGSYDLTVSDPGWAWLPITVAVEVSAGSDTAVRLRLFPGEMLQVAGSGPTAR